MTHAEIRIPSQGEKITYENGKLNVPDQPVIPYIEGDGIGVDISPAMIRVVDAAVEKAYDGRRKIAWTKLPVGEKAAKEFGNPLPQEAIDFIREYLVAIKGPLTTPVGAGIRSLNVTMRQELDLYACVRPVSWIPGVPSPMKQPELCDVIIFRENTEDIYLGVEYEAGSREAELFIELVNKTHKKQLSPGTAVGIKPMTQRATERICESAIRHALAQGRDSITLVHKGNIQKFTEGAFMNWAYDYFKREHRDAIVTEAETWEGASAEGKILIKDRIADAMFQQLLLRPDEYSVIVTTNLNGDYLSDAAAAQVGGLGMAPGGNIGDGVALFEATHGTAPKYAGLDKVNPGSIILSAAMMLDYMGWQEAAEKVREGIAGAIDQKRVTYDLERQMNGATLLSCSEFAGAIIDNIK